MTDSVEMDIIAKQLWAHLDPINARIADLYKKQADLGKANMGDKSRAEACAAIDAEITRLQHQHASILSMVANLKTQDRKLKLAEQKLSIESLGLGGSSFNPDALLDAITARMAEGPGCGLGFQAFTHITRDFVPDSCATPICGDKEALYSQILGSLGYDSVPLGNVYDQEGTAKAIARVNEIMGQFQDSGPAEGDASPITINEMNKLSENMAAAIAAEQKYSGDSYEFRYSLSRAIGSVIDRITGDTIAIIEKFNPEVIADEMGNIIYVRNCYTGKKYLPTP